MPPSHHSSDPTCFGHSFSIWKAAVDAVDARRLVEQAVDVSEETIVLGDDVIDRACVRRVAVVGGGKAAAAMAQGFEAAWGNRFAARNNLHGWINVPAGSERPLQYLHSHTARPAGVNEPTAAAVDGTRQILQTVSTLEPDDLCIVLLSGGGSALLTAPRRGISLSEKVDVTRWLSGRGANIEQLNTVRKHLSDVKGGRLLNACRAGRLVTLIISDVLGDPVDIIASGPTVVDSSTAEDALRILREFDPDQSLPESVYQILTDEIEQRVPQGESSLNVSCQHSLSIIGNNATAVDAAGVRAEQLGYSHAMQSATRSEGEAEQVGGHLARMAIRMLREPGPNCLISGGEPVVNLVPAARRGRGGRNQQLVLSALARLIKEGNLTQSERSRLTILSGGTDGEDGPTDAAGAVLNDTVWSNAEALDLDPHDYLSRNDAYRFFERCGGLIQTGPTNTNVCDVRVITIG
ncbi:MAG: DUF4147 domain-containing protein [Pirellulaceae bacterium]